MSMFVSFFRAINVGGRSTVRMQELKAMHESLGLHDVRTVLQTGNVIFTSDTGDADFWAKKIEHAFEARFGFHSAVMVRSAPELRKIVEKNPFPDNTPANWLVVIFLPSRPARPVQEALKGAYDGVEEMFFVGKELYVHYVNGIGRSKLTNAFIERILKVPGTGRNLNTVNKILVLLEKGDGVAVA